jgi:CheY-like chemotaxis protein
MPHHVLVVDDDFAIRETIAQALLLEGYSVATAANGRQAVDRITESPPKLVLLDLTMPVMSGWELLQWLRNTQPAVPVVIMTAGFRAQAEAERYGADGHLAKPFDLDELYAVLDRFPSAPAD